MISFSQNASAVLRKKRFLKQPESYPEYKNSYWSVRNRSICWKNASVFLFRNHRFQKSLVSYENKFQIEWPFFRYI